VGRTSIDALDEFSTGIITFDSNHLSRIVHTDLSHWFCAKCRPYWRVSNWIGGPRDVWSPVAEKIFSILGHIISNTTTKLTFV
jgi:hypothetical protein